MGYAINEAPSDHRVKPEGGYVQVSTLLLGALWWGYSEGLLSLRAVRVGLALFELRIRRAVHALVERKKGNRSELVSKYTTKELGDFCGLPTKRASAALKELLAFGLVAEFEETHFHFAQSLDSLALSEEQRSEFGRWFGLLTKRRKIPVPRRILALACESASPALIAVILGVCLRCAWKKPEGLSYTGRVSCTWLSRSFRLSLRAVQSAKELLVGLKWMERRGGINRFGETVAINPHWSRLISLTESKNTQEEGAGERAPAPEGANSAGSATPDGTNASGVSLIRESLPSEETKYQRESPASRPESSSGPGIHFEEPSKGNPKTQDPNTSEKTLPAPRLSKIIPEDFSSTGRALELFRQALKCQLMPNDCEHSRLLWLAAIERARTVPARNPAGVFLFLVKNRKWDFLSDGHFDGANERLKKYLHAPVPGAVPFLVPAERQPRLSRDALLVQVVESELAKKGYRGELYPVLRAHAQWDRARFDAALAELSEPRITASKSQEIQNGV